MDKQKTESFLRRSLPPVLALLLILILLLPSVSAEEAAAVRVGQITYPLSLARYMLDSYVHLAETGGGSLTEEERLEAVETVQARLISLGIIENKLTELGQNSFTEDEMDILRAEAARQYEQTWQQIYQDTLAYDSSVTESEVTSWMTSLGYTQDAFLRELMVSEREGRILDLYCSDVHVSEEEIRQYYEENFLNPDRERYADNIPLYEKEILLGRNEAFYTPEGYRYIKNILLPYPEEITGELDALRLEGKRRTYAVQTAYYALADAAAAGEDQTEKKADYDARVKELAEQENAYRARERDAVPMLADTISAIREQLAAGISIDTLLSRYSLDQQQTGPDRPGALYHPASAVWPEEAHQVIGALTAPGQLSEPYTDEEGIHLIYYAGDVPGGARNLTQEEQEALRASALYAAQTQKLTGLIEVWKKSYEITADLSGLLAE
ncbi:MAG: hypothetical protein K5922_06775 [Clostridiales bacterium]|nr:hypothetical protein [Clostridiales bacterium]